MKSRNNFIIDDVFRISVNIIIIIVIINISISLSNCNDIPLPTIEGSNKSLKSILNESNTPKAEANDHISHRIGCASPEVLVNGSPSPDIAGTVSGGNFANIEEIQFVGIIGTMGQKRVCKIKCLNGMWVGPLCALEQDVECPIIDALDANRVMSVEGNHMHDRARFSCLDGYYIHGPQEITCLSSGQWSNAPPKCKVIECPQLSADDDPYLRISDRNRTYGSRPHFSCSTGYKLIGVDFVTCLKNSTWSDAVPHCEAISCFKPTAPMNGRLLDNGRYLVGDYVQYTCNSGYVLLGQTLSICLENGTWSSTPPMCKAVCEYPGELANGHIEPTKFHYNIDETVTVVCHQNFRLLGSPVLRCNANGLWSSPKPHCRPLYF